MTQPTIDGSYQIDMDLSELADVDVPAPVNGQIMVWSSSNNKWEVGNPGGTTASVIATTTTAIPLGFLECDGSAISRTTYAALFAITGTLYGIGDGSTTFNIPDLRGEFIRGFDNARGIDAGRGIGSFQADEFESHSHPSSAFDSTSIHFAASGGENVANDGTATGLSGGTETRPRNVAMVYIIKY